MKKAILIGIIGFALTSIGFATTAFAYDYYDPCLSYGCWDPIANPSSEFIITNINDNNNFNFENNINTNTNNISIGNYGGGSTGGGWYDGGNYYDEPQCDDGIDNDRDGYTDLNDWDCSSYNDDSERGSNTTDETECNDGRDNDGDGYRDLRDAGCRNSSDDSEDSDDNDNEYECNDGRDNDGDGDRDLRDEGCRNSTDDSEDSDGNNNDDDKPEVTTRDASSIGETSATLNGRVDGNGSNTRVWFEYSDNRSDISGDEETSEDSVGAGTTTFDDRITGLRRNTTYYFRAVAKNSDGQDTGTILSFRTDDDNNDGDSECNDGRDNDGDGDRDLRDEGCRNSSDDSEDSENDEMECDDGIDNDRDGYTDLRDAGCSSRNDDSEDSDRNNTNNGSAPYFTSTPSNSITAGQLYSYNADAISPNGRTITYSLALNPAGMTINSFTGLVQWSVPLTLGNTYQPALVVATDTSGNQTTQSYIISVRRQTVVVPPVYPPANPPVNPPVNPPASDLRITNLRTEEVDGDIVVSFNTNISARGSVRYGEVSEASKDSDFTYSFSQISEGGNAAFHEVNLGPLTPNTMYYVRAFASTNNDSSFSPEFAFTRQAPEVDPSTEVAGTATCFDGLDNDRDGIADAADPDCEADVEGQVAGTSTFASALESFGAFLISPWFLLLVIFVLIIYILVTRRQPDVIATHGPIEIKS